MTGSVHHVTGMHSVLETLRAEQRLFNKIFIQEKRGGVELHRVLDLAQSLGIPVQYVPRRYLDRLTHGKHHQGVVGVVSPKEYTSLDDLLQRIKIDEKPLFLIVLDGVEDPHNLGAIVRTAEGAGVDGVVITERRAVGLTSVVSKSSAGALEYLPVARVVNLFQAIEKIKSSGAWVIGVSERAKQSYDTVDFTRPIALVLGGEGEGIRKRTLEACDEQISIPMRGKVSSLNVSVAAGIVAYEVLRQRKEKNNR